MASPNTSTSFALTLPVITQTSAGNSLFYIGTAAQTLPTLTQAGTGTTLEQFVTSTANVSSSVVFDYVAEVDSVVIGTSSTSAITTDSIASSLNASSEATFDVFTSVTSVAQVSSSIPGTIQTTLISSGAAVSSGITQSVTLLVTSVVQAFSTVAITREITIESLVQASSVIVTPGIIYNQLETSVAIGSSQVFPGQEISIASALSAASTVIDTVIATGSIESAANLSSSTVQWATVLEELISVANVSDSVSFEGSIYNETVCSVAHVSDWIWAKDFSAIAWVMNTQSGGLTNYNNFGFTSIAFHSGKLYATSPEGLFELDADNDDGRNINTLIKGGFLDFGSEEKKRISDIYIGHTGGELECDVETYDGPEEVYTYVMESRDADAPRNNRLKVGKGLSSRYWRFSFRNVGGADFQIQDIAVELARSKRRL